MSVSAKHSYRFGYLKSDHWRNLRLQKLASVDAVCARCLLRDTSNDVHHLRYKSLFDVGLNDLLVLCRDCHSKVHEYLDRVISEEFSGGKILQEWEAFIELWGPNPGRIRELGGIIKEMRKLGKLRTKRETSPMVACACLKYSTVSMGPKEYEFFCVAAASRGMELDEWFLFLARGATKRMLNSPARQCAA